MVIRLISIFALAVGLFFAPWWLFLVLGVCGAILNTYFFEFIGISLASDIIYGISGRFHLSGILTTFFISIALVAIIEYSKTIIRKNNEIHI